MLITNTVNLWSYVFHLWSFTFRRKAEVARQPSVLPSLIPLTSLRKRLAAEATSGLAGAERRDSGGVSHTNWVSGKKPRDDRVGKLGWLHGVLLRSAWRWKVEHENWNILTKFSNVPRFRLCPRANVDGFVEIGKPRENSFLLAHIYFYLHSKNRAISPGKLISVVAVATPVTLQHTGFFPYRKESSPITMPASFSPSPTRELACSLSSLFKTR